MSLLPRTLAYEQSQRKTRDVLSFLRTSVYSTEPLLGQVMRIKHRSTVHNTLVRLEQAGLIRRAPIRTATGKTTLLNILADFIPEEDRLLVIEDTAEIHIRKPNLVRFEARRQQGPKIPAVTIRDLLKASLRHRPERTILGEIRGEEAFDLLQALNTGHSGSLSTIHANSAAQALSRFANCVLQSGIELPYRAIKANIADSIHLLVHIERRHARRYVNEVLAIKSFSPADDTYQLETLFNRNQDNLSQESKQ